MTRLIAVLAALWLPVSASALNVFSCEPEWAALVEELAGDNVEITRATTAFQDPHMLQARPSLIAGARNAARSRAWMLSGGECNAACARCRRKRSLISCP